MLRISLVAFSMLPTVLAAPIMPAFAGENWPGYEGGNLHHNHVDRAVNLSQGAAVRWERRFPHPVDCQTTNPGFFGSRNIVLRDGYLAVMATNNPDGQRGFPGIFPYITILDAEQGRVVNCISTTQTCGPRRDQMMYPVSIWMEAYDTGIGLTVLHWDESTGILFCRNGGDNPGNTGYLPLVGREAYKQGFQQGVGAWEEFCRKHPGFQDADGNIRADKEIPCDENRWLDGDQWDYGTVKPTFNNQPNATAFFEVDSDSGLMAAAVDPAHSQSCGFYLANKHTGLYSLVSRGMYERVGDRKWYFGKQVFGKWGGIMVGKGRMFVMGPCDDTGGDGFRTGLQNLSQPDQGLRIAGFDVQYEDLRPNDGYDGPGVAETASLTKAFEYEFHTPHKPRSCEDAESYLEIDAFYRNKAWLIDGKGVWAVWKPTRDGCLQAIFCGDETTRTIDLGIGSGQRGQDIWPHLSLASFTNRKMLVCYAGNAWYRAYDLQKGHRGWSPRRDRPLGPAALSAIDTRTGKGWQVVLNRADGSGPYPSLPPNEAVGYFDRSQLVTTGRWAHIAWVDTTGKDNPHAMLRILSFDLASQTAPEPVAFAHDLGISANDNSQTCLFDLIAADGTLYALITESNTLNSGSHTWTAQRVIAIAPEGESQ